MKNSAGPSPTYTIGDLTKEFDLTRRTIHFYEDIGIVQPLRDGAGGRNRAYSSRDRARVRLTLRAKRIGLSLTQAKDLLDMYESPRDTAPQLEKFLAVLSEQEAHMKQRMSDLQANLEDIKEHESQVRELLLKVPTQKK